MKNFHVYKNKDGSYGHSFHNPGRECKVNHIHINGRVVIVVESFGTEKEAIEAVKRKNKNLRLIKK